MKTSTTVKWIAALTLAAGLTANAQGPGGGNGGGQGGGGPGGGGQGGQHQRPTPEQMAEQMMTKFDANTDGVLSQSELTQALEALRAHHPQGGGGGGGQGGGQGGGAQGAKSGKYHALGGSGGQQGANQGGAGGDHPSPPSADKVAAQMIEKFASDKKGLTKAEFVKALAEHRANRGQQGGGGQQSGGPQGGAQRGGGHPNGPDAGSN